MPKKEVLGIGSDDDDDDDDDDDAQGLKGRVSKSKRDKHGKKDKKEKKHKKEKKERRGRRGDGDDDEDGDEDNNKRGGSGKASKKDKEAKKKDKKEKKEGTAGGGRKQKTDDALKEVEAVLGIDDSPTPSEEEEEEELRETKLGMDSEDEYDDGDDETLSDTPKAGVTPKASRRHSLSPRSRQKTQRNHDDSDGGLDLDDDDLTSEDLDDDDEEGEELEEDDASSDSGGDDLSMNQTRTGSKKHPSTMLSVPSRVGSGIPAAALDEMDENSILLHTVSQQPEYLSMLGSALDGVAGTQSLEETVGYRQAHTASPISPLSGDTVTDGDLTKTANATIPVFGSAVKLPPALSGGAGEELVLGAGGDAGDAAAPSPRPAAAAGEPRGSPLRGGGGSPLYPTSGGSPFLTKGSGFGYQRSHMLSGRGGGRAGAASPFLTFDNYHTFRDGHRDSVLSNLPPPPATSDAAALKAALKVQGEPTAANPVEAAATLRLIVHHFIAQGRTDLVNIMRREALQHNIPLCLTPDTLIQGRDNGDTTELYERFEACLHYLPPIDPTWAEYVPWPTRNYRKDIIILKGEKMKPKGEYVPLTMLIDHLFLDTTHKDDYPYRLPIQKNFTQTFFVTYWEFTDPDTLLTHFGRFYLDIPEEYLSSEKEAAIRVRVMRIIGYWIKHLMVDFPERLLFKAKSLCVVAMKRAQESAAPREVQEAAHTLRKIIDAAIAKGCPRVIPPEKIQQESERPEPMDDLQGSSAVLTSVAGLHDMEVARQMCIISHESFARISIREFFRMAWQQGSDLWTLSGSLRSTVERVSAMGEWVASQIISLETPQARTAQLRAFLRIAYHCLTMRNIAIAQAIFSGVYHKFVRRMPETVGVPEYSVLPETPSHGFTVSEKEMFDELDSVGDIYKHAYRSRIMTEVLKNNEPCVPILAFYQKHLILCQEGGDSTKLLPQGGSHPPVVMVNWDKMKNMADVCVPIITFQSRPYNFQVVPKIRKILIDLPGLLTEAQMKTMSHQREPQKARVLPAPIAGLPAAHSVPHDATLPRAWVGSNVGGSQPPEGGPRSLWGRFRRVSLFNRNRRRSNETATSGAHYGAES